MDLPNWPFVLAAVVVGGLVGWRVLASVRKQLWSAAPKAAKVAKPAPPMASVVSSLMPRATTLAERYEQWGTAALSIEDQQEQAFLALVDLDREQDRREKLMAAARKRRTDNVLKETYLDNRKN